MRSIAFERRTNTPKWLRIAVPMFGIAIALVLGAMLLAWTGHATTGTYRQILHRGFTDPGTFATTLVAATPLLFTGLTAAIAYRMGVFNIGGEGQLFIGAMFASFVGLGLGSAPTVVVVASMILAGAVGGSLWASIAAVLRDRFRCNEIITTLMLNYLAGILIQYLIFSSHSYWRELTGTGALFPQGRMLSERAQWPNPHIGGTPVPFGFIVGISFAVLIFVLLRSTRFGYRVRVIADAPAAAKYAGINARRTTFAVLALSGAMAGIGGASDVGDFRHTLDPKGLQQAGYGYTGIVVAALGRLNPIAVVFVAILMGGLNTAGLALQGPDFPAGLVGTLQGLLLFCTLGGEGLARYRIVIRRRAGSASRSAAPRSSSPRSAASPTEAPGLATGEVGG